MSAPRTLWRSLLLTTFLALAALWTTPVRAQIPVLGGMLDPAIDEPGKPFSYFWHPTDVIGTLYAAGGQRSDAGRLPEHGLRRARVLRRQSARAGQCANQDAAQGLPAHRRVRFSPARCQVRRADVRGRPGGQAARPAGQFCRSAIGEPVRSSRGRPSSARPIASARRSALTAAAGRFSLSAALRSRAEAVQRGPDAVQRQLAIFLRPRGGDPRRSLALHVSAHAGAGATLAEPR